MNTLKSLKMISVYVYVVIMLGYLSALTHCYKMNYSVRRLVVKMMATSSSSTELQSAVILEKGKARLFQDGNPLIYGGAVKEVIGSPSGGEEVLVKDHNLNVIGRGFFNPYSQYRVRMTCRSYESVYNKSLHDLLDERILQCIRLRESLLLPSKSTSVYRLVNGEGDRLSGLIVDVIGRTLVIQSSALWVEHNRKTIESVFKIRLFSDKNSHIQKVIWRKVDTRLKQDGYTGECNDDIVYDELKTAEGVDEIVIENDIKYVVQVEDGQKTGFYCDQRENRLLLRKLSQGKSVLDTYAYTGGFSLNCALGGATEVTSVDTSKLAVDTITKNAVLNKMDKVITCHKADAVEFMESLQNQKQFDIVITDPPKLAPTRTSLAKAKNKYIKINSLAISLVKPGGMLFTCTCSAACTQSGEFVEMLADAARIAKRDITILSSSGAAFDHPIYSGYPEGRYLTGVLAIVA